MNILPVSSTMPVNGSCRSESSSCSCRWNFCGASCALAVDGDCEHMAASASVEIVFSLIMGLAFFIRVKESMHSPSWGNAIFT